MILIYGNICTGYNNAEINVYLPYVKIDEWFFEGHEAEQVINDIYKIWLLEEITTQEAINQYAFINLH